MTPIDRVQGRLLIGTIAGIADIKSVNKEDNMNFVILASSMQDEPISKCRRIHIPVVAGKRGQSYFLQTILPTATAFIRDSLTEEKRISIVCESGKDLSVGVALAALQLFFQDNGRLISMEPDSTLSQGTFFIFINLMVLPVL